MRSLENRFPDTLLLQVWVQLFLIFPVKIFSLFLSAEPDFRLEPWLPGPCTLSLCFSFAQTEQVERNYIKEKKAAVKEFEDKKVELKENLIAELEEKKKMIENEKLTMELTGGMKAAAGFLEPWGGPGGGHSNSSFYLLGSSSEQSKLKGEWALKWQVRVLVMSCIGCVTLVKLLNLSEPVSPSIKWGWLYPISEDCG